MSDLYEADPRAVLQASLGKIARDDLGAAERRADVAKAIEAAQSVLAAGVADDFEREKLPQAMLQLRQEQEELAELHRDVSDAVTWAAEQAELLHRLARGEQINATTDWANIAEDIEDVGISEINATLSQIDNVLGHRIYLLGWPASLSVRMWQAEVRDFQRPLARHCRPSMTTGANPRVTDDVVREAYAAAVDYCRAHMHTDPTQPLPKACPWSLDMLPHP
jgi:Domain of unknown function DUF29